MPAYFIGNYTIINPKLYMQYVSKAMPLTIKHGGRALVAGEGTQILEGNPGGTTIVLQFPSMDAAMAWYNDPEYQAIIPMRHEATEGGFAQMANEFVLPG